MIIINLKGGTGNQLFQYAFGRYLAIKNNDVLKLDVAGLARANAVGDIYRPPALGAFAVAADIATAEEVRQLKYPYGIFSKAWRFIAFKLSKDKNTLFKAARLEQEGNIYLDGFWQSPRYFDAIRDTLLADLTLIKPLAGAAAAYAADIAASESVSLHVRRGDYAKNPRVNAEFGVCSTAYYEKAIQEIRSVVRDPKFFVFSDDIGWVKANLPVGDEAVFVEGEGLTDTMELVLMSTCHHNIIANSTFSWWGAWLNQNPTKIVIAPQPWFNTTPYDTDLIPSAWKQLPK